ncbi:MAG: N-acetylmuramoyl-L-alanine amidase [Firmicutes bacterium]|nr:N-acetylmuramoyl-L-alanine amidase [Bacillota bacterium]
MKTMGKIIFITFFTVFCALFYVNAYASDIRLIIDEQEVSGLPSPPIIRNDSVLVPARAVFERMGGTVGWHSGNRQVTVFHGDDVLVMTIDDNVAMLNGSPVLMPTPPVIINGSTMIPLRFPGEAFGFGVRWDRESRTAILNSPVDENTNYIPDYPEGPPLSLPPFDEYPTSNLEYHDPATDIYPKDVPSDEETEQSCYKSAYNGMDITTLPPGTGLEPAENVNLARNVSSAPITTVSHPQTNITHVLTPYDVDTAAYVIVASSPITGVSYLVLSDNRIAIDIHNSANMISDLIPAHSSVPVSAVRTSQFSTEPMISRVVFHVTQATEFTLALSANRESLTIAFASNKITKVSLQSDSDSDILTIQGSVLPSFRVSTEGFPNFLTINIDNAEMLASGSPDANGAFATHFTTGQRDDDSSYIRVYVGDNWPNFSVEHTNSTIMLTLHRGVTGIRYDSLRRELHISKATGFTMDIAQVQHIDEYLRLRYSLVLPNSASVLGRGEIGIMDGLINTVTLQQDTSGNARLVFDTTRVLAFTIYETPESYIIRANLPREVHPFIVVIDPGHGGWNIGSAHNGVVERHLALALSEKVIQLLENNPNIRAYRTRWDDSGIYNYRRAEFANELNADLFISIHANAAVHNTRPVTVNPAPHGIETWYNFGERERNNTVNNRFTSRQFAEIIQRHKIARTGANCRGERYGPGLIVLRESNMPSVLLEVGFLTNPAEAARLATTQHQWLLAQAIYDAIVEAANTYPRP